MPRWKRRLLMSPNTGRETTVTKEKTEGIHRDAKRSDGFLEATTEGLAFHDVLGAAHLMQQNTSWPQWEAKSAVVVELGLATMVAETGR